MIKVLIISRTPWDNSNSFGNTFSNLFENMDGVDIYNICCQHGTANNNVVKKAIQFTDKSVLKNVFTGKDYCRVIGNDNKVPTYDDQDITKKKLVKVKTLILSIRDFVWKLGAWKKSKVLNDFLKEVKPDVVYLPIYASHYMCYVQSYLIDKLGVPVVGHISDDVYGIPKKAKVSFKNYRKRLQKKVSTLISKCSYLEVFAENMKEEYEKTFNVPCYVIGKGINVESIKPFNYSLINSNVSFVYTGNIGSERYKSLAMLGKALDKVYDNAVLNVYSASALTKEIENEFSKSKSIKFHGRISREEVDEVQKQADYLVHVESFSDEGVFSAKMSFSTKIIDYMLMGKPIIAVGPAEVNSMQVLKNYGCAITCENENEIEEKVKLIKDEKIDLNQLSNNVYNYLVEYRNIKTIQQGIKQRLQSLIK
ncbi:MAG: glycosyltransferase [Clostridia bacterium]|nr:glycosyltransferase [Clostridia bacterium]